MRLLDIRANLGPGIGPAHIEAVIRGVRVATDVAYDAESGRVRRAATERMKFPTDDELASALDRLPSGDERGPRYRAQQHLEARRLASREARGFPPDLWFEYWYRRTKPGSESSSYQLYSAAGYDRLSAWPLPFAGALGLDVIDPILYEALVADELARNLPGRVGVRLLQYENPFWTTLFGKRAAEKSVSTTVQVIEVVRDYKAMRAMAEADAAVAEATVSNRIAESDLDVALKQEELRAARLRNERAELENAALRNALSPDEQRRRLVEGALRLQRIEIADGIRALGADDVQALTGLAGLAALEAEERWEPDDDSLD